MNLGELEGRLDLIVQDESLKSHYKGMINQAILELAADYELPALRLLDPVTLPVDTTSWLWPLPKDFHKKLFRCANALRWIRVYRHIDDLTRLDRDHDQKGDSVTTVAWGAQGLQNVLGIYPLADDALDLWYFRKPAVLVKSSDICDCIPPEFHERVIVPKVIIVNYAMLQDQVENFDPKSLQFWQGELAKGLRGSPDQGPGLFNYLQKLQGGPRRHGGRDPVGWNPNRYPYGY